MTKEEFDKYSDAIFTGISLTTVRKELRHSIELTKNMVFSDYDQSMSKDFDKWKFVVETTLTDIIDDINTFIRDTNRAKLIYKTKLSKEMKDEGDGTK